jgi:hypothetical protein
MLKSMNLDGSKEENNEIVDIMHEVIVQTETQEERPKDPLETIELTEEVKMTEVIVQTETHEEERQEINANSSTFSSKVINE